MSAHGKTLVVLLLTLLIGACSSWLFAAMSGGQKHGAWVLPLIIGTVLCVAQGLVMETVKTPGDLIVSEILDREQVKQRFRTEQARRELEELIRQRGLGEGGGQ